MRLHTHLLNILPMCAYINIYVCAYACAVGKRAAKSSKISIQCAESGRARRQKLSPLFSPWITACG